MKNKDNSNQEKVFSNNKDYYNFFDYMKMAKELFINFFKKNPTRIIIVGFAFAILFGALLIAAPVSNRDGNWLNPLDALFTTTSAVCVTGLVCVDIGTQFTTYGQIIIMVLIQIGGLGFMTATTLIFLLFGRRITLNQRMIIKESFDELGVQGLVKLINRIFIYTAVVETISFGLLCIYFIPQNGLEKGAFYALFHSVSSFCNAGFDILHTKETAFQSITHLQGQPLAPLVVLPLAMNIFIGGLGFSVISDIATHRKNKRRLKTHTVIVLFASIGVVFITGTLFILFEMNNAMKDMSVGEKIMAGYFQGITSRTSGFAYIDQATMAPESRALSMVTMFIGAAPGSTGGGIKITTFVVLIFVGIGTIIGKDDINLRKQRISSDLANKAVAILVFAMTAIFVTVLIVSGVEAKNIGKNRITLDSIVFECISAFSTTGLSMGITPYLTRVSRFFISLLMFIGRCGTVTIGVAMLLNKFKKGKSNIRYPDSTIRLG